MIDAGYCRVMARYNAWQNKGLRAIVDAMDEDALRHDRGAFFGSIFGTLNHLLWGDLVWMARFAGGDAPPQAIADSPDMTATPVEWSTHRFRTDGRISLWADKLASVDLVGDLTWYSEAAKREVTQPMQTCIVHFESLSKMSNLYISRWLVLTFCMRIHLHSNFGDVLGQFR